MLLDPPNEIKKELSVEAVFEINYAKQENTKQESKCTEKLVQEQSFEYDEYCWYPD